MSLILLNLLARREPSYTSYLHRPWLIPLLSLARMEKMQRTRRSGAIAKMDSAAADFEGHGGQWAERAVTKYSLIWLSYTTAPNAGGNDMYTDIYTRMLNDACMHVHACERVYIYM